MPKSRRPSRARRVMDMRRRWPGQRLRRPPVEGWRPARGRRGARRRRSSSTGRRRNPRRAPKAARTPATDSISRASRSVRSPIGQAILPAALMTHRPGLRDRGRKGPRARRISLEADSKLPRVNLRDFEARPRGEESPSGRGNRDNRPHGYASHDRAFRAISWATTAELVITPSTIPLRINSAISVVTPSWILGPLPVTTTTAPPRSFAATIARRPIQMLAAGLGKRASQSARRVCVGRVISVSLVLSLLREPVRGPPPYRPKSSARGSCLDDEDRNAVLQRAQLFQAFDLFERRNGRRASAAGTRVCTRRRPHVRTPGRRTFGDGGRESAIARSRAPCPEDRSLP